MLKNSQKCHYVPPYVKITEIICMVIEYFLMHYKEYIYQKYVSKYLNSCLINVTFVNDVISVRRLAV